MNQVNPKNTETALPSKLKHSSKAIAKLNAIISDYEKSRKWVADNAFWLDEIGIDPAFTSNFILFQKTTHATAIEIIKAIGGKWDKSYSETTVSYTCQKDGFYYLISDSQPPASCKLVPVVEVIPAHWEEEQTVKRFKIQCKEPGSETDTAAPEEPAPDSVPPAPPDITEF